MDKPEENFLENHPIKEMVMLHKNVSDLPANLYLNDTGSWAKTGHWRIIKFQPNTGDHPVTSGIVPMSIEDDPQILLKNAKIALTVEQIEQIKKFVRINKDLLLQLADTEIDIIDFLGRMVISDDPEGYLSEKENLLENFTMEFLAMLSQSETGLSANLFLDDTASWSRFGCWKIIKFQPNTEDRPVIDTRYRVPMSIEDDPQILFKNAKIALTVEQIEQIKKFVRINKDLLLQLADAEIGIFEFIESMVKV